MYFHLLSPALRIEDSHGMMESTELAWNPMCIDLQLQVKVMKG